MGRVRAPYGGMPPTGFRGRQKGGEVPEDLPARMRDPIGSRGASFLGNRDAAAWEDP